MFDSLVAAADGTCGVGAVGAWARVVCDADPRTLEQRRAAPSPIRPGRRVHRI
jgi:hypothetical protein